MKDDPNANSRSSTLKQALGARRSPSVLNSLPVAGAAKTVSGAAPCWFAVTTPRFEGGSIGSAIEVLLAPVQFFKLGLRCRIADPRHREFEVALELLYSAGKDRVVDLLERACDVAQITQSPFLARNLRHRIEIADLNRRHEIEWD